MGNITESRLLDHVGRIYDCILWPDRWHPTVDAIREDFAWHNAMLGVYSFRDDGQSFQVAIGIPEEYGGIANDPTYVPDAFQLWGGKSRIDAAPLEEPVLQSQMGDPSTWRNNRYFKAFAEPQGLVDAVSVGLARDSSMVATLTGGLHVSRGPSTQDEIAGLRALAPHLRRAVTISNLFDNLLAQKRMFSEALEASRAGIMLVDQDLTILHANRVAQRLLDGSNPIRVVNDRLVMREELSQRALIAAVKSSASLATARASGIPTRRSDGTIMMVHTFPLTGREIRQQVGLRATTAVLVAASSEPLDVDNEALALLYNLTPAEVRIVNLSSKGLTMAETGRTLGIAASTVKTHLLRIYEKTGTRRRAELVGLLRRISSPW